MSIMTLVLTLCKLFSLFKWSIRIVSQYIQFTSGQLPHVRLIDIALIHRQWLLVQDRCLHCFLIKISLTKQHIKYEYIRNDFTTEYINKLMSAAIYEINCVGGLLEQFIYHTQVISYFYFFKQILQIKFYFYFQQLTKKVLATCHVITVR